MSHTEQPAFQRAFVAIGYLLEQRGAALLEPLHAPTAEARTLVRHLAHPDRQQRAEALAFELKQIAIELEACAIR
jgi:hypothetical protein